MAVLHKVDILSLPACRMVGLEVEHPGLPNPVPALWHRVFEQDGLAPLRPAVPVLPYYVGWMGNYQRGVGRFAYIAGMLLPAGTFVPEDFSSREIAPCTAGLAMVQGDFSDGSLYSRLYEMAAFGLGRLGWQADDSFGWTAEAYPTQPPRRHGADTVLYLCPCKPAR